MKLGTRVGLGPGHIVLDGDTVPLPKGAQPPVFGPYLLWPNGSIYQDATWYNGRPRPGNIVLDADPAHPKGHSPPPHFGPCPLWPNGWMDQDATWY